MTREEFFQNDDVYIIQFVCYLKNEIEQLCKIHRFKTQNQIIAYVNNNIKSFISKLNAKEPLKYVYKYEIINTMDRFLKEISTKYNLFYVC